MNPSRLRFQGLDDEQERTIALDTSERDARDLPASEDARRSGEWVAGHPERPRDLIDWHYGSSPFCAELQSERLLAFRRAEQWVGADESPYGSHPSTALLEADNDNNWLRLVR